jgi:hypothetical protein
MSEIMTTAGAPEPGIVTREPPLGFDPTGLDAEQIETVKTAQDEIRTRLERRVIDVWEIGDRLVRVKRILGHGRFTDWLRTAFELSESTARGWIRVRERFETRAAILRFQNADVSAVRLLAAGSATRPSC